MSRTDRGAGRLYLPKFRTKTGELRHSLVWWWEVPDGHGGKLRGSTNVRGGTPAKPPKEAREILYAKRAELGRGALLPGVLTWERVSKAYLQECEALGLESVPLYRARAAHLDRFFAGTRARDLVEERNELKSVAAYVAHRRGQGAKVATINLELAVLRRAFRLAVRKGRLPMGPHAPRIRGNNVRQGFIPEADLEALLELMPLDRADVARFMRATGWRESEPLLLDLRQVDWGLKVVHLEAGQTKTRKPRQFPFGDYPALRQLLERRRDMAVALGRQLGRIIPSVFFEPDGARITTGAFYGSWLKARRALGLKWTPHDLRRTWARWALLQGTEPTTVMALGGWETMGMLQRYAIKDLVPLQAGVAKLGAAPAPADTGQLVLFRG
jgi:integrase